MLHMPTVICKLLDGMGSLAFVRQTMEMQPILEKENSEFNQKYSAWKLTLACIIF